jgi:hypothetical protein
MRKIGEVMLFTGGAETTPRVEVIQYHTRGSLNSGNTSFLISQDGKEVVLSPETLAAILQWYRG